MSDKRTTTDEGTTITATTKANDVSDIVRDNALRIVDEVAKVQPQFAQSISNLQVDNIQTVRSMIQTAFANHKQQFNVHAPNFPQTLQMSEVVANQSTEITNSIIRSIAIFNQLGVTALNSAREYVNTYKRTVDAFTDYNNDLSRAWTSYGTSQLQQFHRA
jgi:hypothetical protein